MPFKCNFKNKLILIILLILFNQKNIFKLFFFDAPLVSIIILVNNDNKYIFNCISSIINTKTSICYEIIINYLSNNENNLIKKQYFKNLSNIKVLKFKKYKNFLMNYNRAVKFSKGKYILFLRDNTRVHKDWLDSLIRLIESNKKIGMVGSKIIYPNGTLEEAGGIVWNNGEFLNLGKGNDIDLSEYDYVREVDYLSLKSIIIKKSFWKRFGGFNEKILSINYNEIDFAFKIRKNGYKVMYQPKSIVEYCIGNKNITFISKINEETSKKIFVEKWKNELKYQFKKGNIFMAKDRCFNKKRIFVIDRYVPNFDKDAGSRCSFMYLNIFQEIGFQVTFLPSDLKKREPYTSILQQKGIEVLYGNKFDKNSLEKWIKNKLKYFKYIYLQRPDISIKYIDLIKKYNSNKIIYFAHDLHYIRLSRKYNITHEIKFYFRSKKFQKIEMEIFSKVDVIYVVGNYEYKILKEQLKNKIIRNIPLYFYENHFKNIEKNFSKRKDLIFVGGMHDTNRDAVMWFSKEVYPIIIKKYPNIVWHIVTNKIDYIKNLESKNVKIEINLSDEKLHSLYQKCRLAIAPLRFGAGVKGKVVEAAYNQIPMVTTPIGAEGIDNSVGSFIIANTSEKMAEIISNLYADFKKLKKMSDSGKILIDKYFSKVIAKKIILNDFT